MKKTNVALLLVSMLLGIASNAQSLPGELDATAQRKKIMETLDAATQMGSPSGASQVRRTQPNFDELGKLNAPSNTHAKPADFRHLSQIGGLSPSPAVPERKGSDLMIFVSLSMPDQMLANYAVQAKRFGAVILLRGFVDDKASRTREVLARLNQAGAEFEISPEPFKYFKITKVPTFVLAAADAVSVVENGCARPDTYVSISGDITVLDALDKFSLLSRSGLASDAKARIISDRQTGKKG